MFFRGVKVRDAPDGMIADPEDPRIEIRVGIEAQAGEGKGVWRAAVRSDNPVDFVEGRQVIWAGSVDVITDGAVSCGWLEGVVGVTTPTRGRVGAAVGRAILPTVGVAVGRDVEQGHGRGRGGKREGG